MRILWLSWKDISHPIAGGAEVISDAIRTRLARDGHEVMLIAGGYAGCTHEETRDGVRIVRLGGRYSVYYYAWQYYRAHLHGWADVIIDECNTLPFFAHWYASEPVILLPYQLCREIWWYQMPFPLSVVGYLLEPLYLRCLSGMRVVTESESTRADLTRYGFDRDRISVMRVGIDLPSVPDPRAVRKSDAPTLLAFSAVRPMKRTLDIVKAFEIAKTSLLNLQLVVAGNMTWNYGERVRAYIEASPHRGSIVCMGRVSHADKIRLLGEAHVIAVTSVKEGWGLIVTEANSQGTPAVVYDVDGLRDSVHDNETGMIAHKNTPQELGDAVVALLGDPDTYERLQRAGWEWSRTMTFEGCYEDFCRAVGITTMS